MPTTQSLLKPRSHGGTLFVSSSEIGYASGDTLTLKGTTFSFSGEMPAEDGTVEAKPYGGYKTKNRIGGRIGISGHAIIGEAIGFANLPDENVSVVVNLGTRMEVDGLTITRFAHRLTFTIVITSLSVDWKSGSATVPVTVRGIVTGNMYETDVETTIV